MKKLLKGIKEFRQKSLADYREKYAKFAHGQSPDTMLIACCDSRVVPNVFASTNPGDLFVLRNIGNIIPPHKTKDAVSVAAAIEFAITTLNVSDVIICGHSDCAAMRAFTENHLGNPDSAIHHWLAHAKPAFEIFNHMQRHEGKEANSHNLLSHINVLQQIEHLKTYPEISEKLQQGTLKLHGWWFDVETADVTQYDEEKKEFVLIGE